MTSSILRILSLGLSTVVCIGCTTQGDVAKSSHVDASSSVAGRQIPSGRSGAKISPPMAQAPSTDYGYSESKPVLVGGLVSGAHSGPASERRYLEALRGPRGETITYERVGSCCSFETPRGFKGIGRLDTYRVTFKGSREPVVLYLNMYDSGELYVPLGFTAAQ